MAPKHILISVLFFQDPETDTWNAQVLEYDIAAYGHDEAAARRALARTIGGYFTLGARHHRDPFHHLEPAPERFWTIWRELIDAKPAPVEPITAVPAFMVPAVSHEPLSSAH